MPSTRGGASVGLPASVCTWFHYITIVLVSVSISHRYARAGSSVELESWCERFQKLAGSAGFLDVEQACSLGAFEMSWHIASAVFSAVADQAGFLDIDVRLKARLCSGYRAANIPAAFVCFPDVCLRCHVALRPLSCF